MDSVPIRLHGWGASQQHSGFSGRRHRGRDFVCQLGAIAFVAPGRYPESNLWGGQRHECLWPRQSN